MRKNRGKGKSTKEPFEGISNTVSQDDTRDSQEEEEEEPNVDDVGSNEGV